MRATAKRKKMWRVHPLPASVCVMRAHVTPGTWMNSQLHLVLGPGRSVLNCGPVGSTPPRLPPPRRLSNPALSPCGQHMREAAERRQQLELEHEQALAVLNAKQQEIDLLQKVGGRSAQVWTHSHVRSGSGSTPAALLWGTGDPDSIEMTSESVKGDVVTL